MQFIGWGRLFKENVSFDNLSKNQIPWNLILFWRTASQFFKQILQVLINESTEYERWRKSVHEIAMWMHCWWFWRYSTKWMLRSCAGKFHELVFFKIISLSKKTKKNKAQTKSRQVSFRALHSGGRGELYSYIHYGILKLKYFPEFLRWFLIGWCLTKMTYNLWCFSNQK